MNTGYFWPIYGDRDEVVPFDMGRTLSELLPNAELHVVEGAGHNDLFLKDPRLVSRLASFARASMAERAKLDAPAARRAREHAGANEATNEAGAPKAPVATSRRGVN